jgi:Tfp pilus assembly protein PilX
VNNVKNMRHQRGATLIVGLIMLVLITLMMLTAFLMSSTNLKAVGNMQSREEATAAANYAMEKVVELDFTKESVYKDPQPYTVDIDQNVNTPPYQVTVNVIGCKRFSPAPLDESKLSGVTASVSSSIEFDTLWELEAVVADPSTGTSVTTVQGVRKRMNAISDIDFSSQCGMP